MPSTVYCNFQLGFGLQCKDGIGGIRKLYLGLWTNIGPSITLDAGNNEIVTDMGSEDIYEFVLPKHTGNFEEVGTYDINNGTGFYVQTINATFHKLSQDRSWLLQEMAKTRLVAVVEDNNGNFFVCGVIDAVEITAMTSATGTAKGDLNGYTITLTGEEKSKAPMFPDFPGGLSIVNGTL
jgi:hypothetical protein